jgi:hypothetical protein
MVNAGLKARNMMTRTSTAEAVSAEQGVCGGVAIDHAMTHPTSAAEVLLVAVVHPLIGHKAVGAPTAQTFAVEAVLAAASKQVQD